MGTRDGNIEAYGTYGAVVVTDKVTRSARGGGSIGRIRKLRPKIFTIVVIPRGIASNGTFNCPSNEAVLTYSSWVPRQRHPTVQHQVGPWMEGIDRIDGGLEHGIGVDQALVQVSGRAYLRIRNMGNPHGLALFLAASSVCQWRWRPSLLVLGCILLTVRRFFLWTGRAFKDERCDLSLYTYNRNT